jgi:hypothetical protein
MARVLSALALAVPLVAVPRGAEAAEEPAASVAFDAPMPCGTADAFADRVSARASAHVAVVPDAAYIVRITRTGSTFRGSLRAAGGPGPERSVEGARCASVVDALALLTAMAIDAARAETSEPDAGAPREDPRTPVPQTHDSGPAAPLVVEVRPLVEGQGLSLTASGTWAMLEASGATGAALGLGWAPSRADYWVPVYHVGAAWQAATRRTGEGGVADLRWALVTGRACLARSAWSSALVGLCALSQLGTFTLDAARIAGLERDRSLWLAFGTGASLRLLPSPRVGIDIAADFLAPVNRPLFVTTTPGGPIEEVYRASGVSLLVSLGAAWLFR